MKLHIIAGRQSIIVWTIIIALMLMPAIISLLFIREYGINVLYWDQWETIPLFDKLYTGHLTFTDLFAQHNEHRMVFPRLVMLFLGNLTQYNNLAEMYLSWLLLCLIIVLLFKFYTRYFGTTQVAMAKFIPVIWLIFSLRQWENLLWGFQFAWFMVILFSILSLYLLATCASPGWRLWLAIVSAVVCSFSSAQGLLVWPIGLILILLTFWSQGKEPKWPCLKIVSIWCLIGILVYIGYFVGYTKPSHHPDLLYFLSNPVTTITYTLASIGSPLAFDMTSAVGMGILVLALYIFVVAYLISRKLMTPTYVPFILSLILCALFTVAILVSSRAGFGADQAMASRYTSETMLGIIGLYIMIISIEINGKIKLFLSGFIIALIVLGIFTTYSRAIVTDGKSIRDYRTLSAEYLANIEMQNDENIKMLYPSPQIVKERANILKKYHLNVFSLDFMYKYKIVNENQVTQLTGLTWTPTGGWSIEGTYNKEKPYFARYTYGSYSGSDGNTGVLKSSAIKIEAPEYFVMYIITGPTPTGQTIGLDTNGDGKPDILYPGNAKEQWEQWVVDLTPYINKEVSIVATDEGKDWGEWVGVSEPFIMLKSE